VHPRYRTPAAAILLQGTLALALAFTGSFAQLALLSAVARLCSYIGTAAALLVLQRRYGDRPEALQLPGGPLVPVAALLLGLALVASASAANLIAAAVALAVGALIFLFYSRKPA
jgi:basic amino acid/polyamine antiporter, APA family